MSSTIAREEGFKFEYSLIENLKTLFPKLVIRSEKEIKSEYGDDISGIDIEIFKEIKIKNLKKEKNIHVLIQAKWRDYSETVKNVNHYIKCCAEIKNLKKLEDDCLYCIYATKMDVSKTSKDALSRLINTENMVCSDMDRCIYNVSKRVGEIFGKKISSYVDKKELEQIFKDENFEELKKTKLIELVAQKYAYSKKEINKLKHSQLVDILKSKNTIKFSVEKKETKSNTDILKIEFENPNERNAGEVKSKLLKPGSPLYNHITKLKNILRQNNFAHIDRMGLHVEVLNNNCETLEDFLSRVKTLEGKEINIKDLNNYDIIGNAVVLTIGELEGYKKDAKITIAYMPSKTDDALKCIVENI